MFEQSGALRGQLPEHHSRYAPLLGMLADAAAGDRHGIDFLQPRRRPQAKTRRREATIAAVAVAALALIFVGWTWWRLNSLDGQIADLGQRGRDLDKQIKQNEKVEKEAAELDRWLAADVPWLDVLHRLSTQAPKADEVMLTGLKADIEKAGGGKLTLDVLAADATKVSAQFEKTYPNTTRGTIDYDGKVSRYPWTFKTETRIDQKTVAQLKGAAAKKSAGKQATKPGDTKTPPAKPQETKDTEAKAPQANVMETKATAKPADEKPSTESPDASKAKAVTVPSSEASKGEAQPTAVEGSPAATQPAPAVQPAASPVETKAAPAPSSNISEKITEKGG
jgi:hypothetical protein